MRFFMSILKNAANKFGHKHVNLEVWREEKHMKRYLYKWEHIFKKYMRCRKEKIIYLFKLIKYILIVVYNDISNRGNF